MDNMDNHSQDENAVEIVDLDQQPDSHAPAWLVQGLHKFSSWQPSSRTRTAFFISTLLVCALVLLFMLDFHLAPINLPKQSLATPEASVTPNISNLPPAQIANGIVYFETPDGTVMARQATTGKVVWQIFQGGRNSTFEVINQAIYRLNCPPHESCTLEARNALNGILLWIRLLPPAGPAPLMGNNNIIYFYTSNGILLALNPPNGNTLWQYATHTSEPLNFSLTTDTFTFLTPDTRVHVLRNSDGAQLLTYVNASGWWEPFIQDNIIYYEPDSSTIVAQNLNTGHILWQYIGQGLPVNISTKKDNQVYLNVGRFQGIIALNATTGKLLWRYDATLKTGPEFQNGAVYIGLQNNTVVALRASDGSLLWQQIVSPFQYGLLVAGNVICLGQNNAIQALGTDGSIRWIYLTPAPILWYPDASDGLLLINYINGNNHFDVVRSSDGTILWNYP